MRFFMMTLLLLLSPFPAARAEEPSQDPACKAVEDRACLTNRLGQLAEKIEKDSWRDQTYREMAKTMATDGRALEALPLIDKIINPDTKALTIRGIGVEAATHGHATTELFTKLSEEAKKITYAPSHGIALTYIAMAQAFAGDDSGAAKTASGMDNADLRNKAYGETAEIQAEQGKFAAAMNSIRQIEAVSFRNKAYKTVSGIFAEGRKYQDAYDTSLNIENPVMQAEAIQFILDHQIQSEDKEND